MRLRNGTLGVWQPSLIWDFWSDYFTGNGRWDHEKGLPKSEEDAIKVASDSDYVRAKGGYVSDAERQQERLAYQRNLDNLGKLLAADRDKQYAKWALLGGAALLLVAAFPSGRR